ncbi:archaellin/type IV pilin N-terminal domain-containing protein [Haloferax larsenii]|uniref:Flagellin n=1 Tax=Haloferax larsenii TaxID=302484 RepID=A0A1H7SEI3_HALLR|nr:archaellin/type IV pilin N-terminal domain-containing protein [Haloferax larsenii]SEL70905.1 flagellin FlaB [Haloferax larsenii]
MFELPRNDGRGQVGIGTLIVFIAMVLVAAVAAGVLVNTAGFLQATAEDAGQQSVNKITNRVEVLNAHGVVGTADNIKDIKMNLRLAAGSGSVDLNSTTIKYISTTSVQTLTNQSTAGGDDGTPQTPDADEFAIEKVTADDGTFGVLNTMGDRYTIIIAASDVETGTNGAADDKGLSTGDQLTLEVTSRNGGTTPVILNMPQQLAGRDDGDPVKL